MNEKVKNIEESIPEEILKVFKKEYQKFVFTCSDDVFHLIKEETGEEFADYLDIFMSYPHY